MIQNFGACIALRAQSMNENAVKAVDFIIYLVDFIYYITVDGRSLTDVDMSHCPLLADAAHSGG